MDLFSGIGGLSIALEEWVKTIAYCENDRHAQSVLLSRMVEGEIEAAPICTDVREIKKDNFQDPIEIIFGGFPCQDISVAGTGKGLAGERSGLFFEIIRLVKELKPPFVFLENVPAIRTRGLLEVAQAFTEIRYDCRWMCITAASVGAPHKRERWFLLAHTSHDRFGELLQPIEKCGSEKAANPRSDGKAQLVAYTNGKITTRLPGREKAKRSELRSSSQHELESSWWSTEPNVDRMVDGIPFRVERIKRLGNAVVPLQAKEAFKKLLNLK